MTNLTGSDADSLDAASQPPSNSAAARSDNATAFSDSAAAFSDIVIVGGGLAGASLAQLLGQQTKFSVTLVEAFTLPAEDAPTLAADFDARSTALTAGSLDIYQQLGLLDDLLAESADITLVDVSIRGYLGRTQLKAEEVQRSRLGACIESRRLGRLLLDSVRRQGNTRLLSPHKVTQLVRLDDGYRVVLDDATELRCRLLVVADGARSTTRGLLGIAGHHDDSGEAALTLNVALNGSHQGQSFERFLDSGPLAFLPLPPASDGDAERMTVVWTGKRELIDELMALSGDAFAQRLREQAALLDIDIQTLGKRASHPLVASHSAAQAIPFAVVVGNAAHALHPVAAQGFNLSLRDLDCLVSHLADAANPGDLDVLEAYVAERRLDQAIIGRASRWLPEIFRVRLAPFAHARQLGLVGMALLPGVRRAFTRRAMGTGETR